ncbi:MAG: SDR family oxidoreductase [Mariprofundaceae bacterium]
MPAHLLILGCGYVGEHLASACLKLGMKVSATNRSAERSTQLQSLGIHTINITSPAELTSLQLISVTHLIDSIPLTNGDKTTSASQVQWLPSLIPKLSHLQWVGYLSTTGVYGDTAGHWVDEDHHCQPSSARGLERLIAERLWLNSKLPAEIFRLAGIYGPKRNIVPRLMAGEYKAVQWNPPHYSSRIHIDDIVAALTTAIQKPRAGRIINIADDLPLPHADYVQQLADIIGAPKPIILTPLQAEKQLSAKLLSFFSDNKRISNKRLHSELLSTLKYPNFKHAFTHL